MTVSTPQKSSAWLYIVLLLVIGLTIWTAMQDDEQDASDVVELAAERKQKTIKPIVNEPLAPLLEEAESSRLARTPTQRKIVNLFKTKRWYTPPRASRAVSAPMQDIKPTAPPLPFKYNGKLAGIPGGTVIFLVQGKKLYTAQLGQKVNASWRLDAETDRALEFTYLPLDLKSTLSKSATSSGFSQAMRQTTRPNRQIIPE